MKSTRRTFIKSCAAASFAGAFGITGRAEAGAGDIYPGWKPGELDLHFVYTGCGENMFYRLPDGTAILNDTGDFYRPRDLANVPLLPSPERLGGEWMSRYVQRVYQEKVIDYLMFSHWHGDHIGHSTFDRKETPGASFRYKTLADGTRINGFLCVAQNFGFKRYFDHQYPNKGMYGGNDSCIKLVSDWLAVQKGKGLVCEPFKVGALNQIALQRDPGKYPNFSIRNICANGRLWDGKDGERDLVGEYVAQTGAKRIAENTLSLGFVMQYGKFRFWSGGDTQNIPQRDERGVRSRCSRAGVRVVHLVPRTGGGADAIADGLARDPRRLRSADPAQPDAEVPGRTLPGARLHEEHRDEGPGARGCEGAARRRRIPRLPAGGARRVDAHPRPLRPHCCFRLRLSADDNRLCLRQELCFADRGQRGLRA